MIQIKLTPEEFAAKCAQLKAEQGIVLEGDTGILEHKGFAGNYAYDDTTLSITVTHYPFFLSEGFVEQHLLAWFAGS